MTDFNGIIEFLIRAKRATYAGKGPETVSSRPKSRDLQYREDQLFYFDTYLGSKSFAGEEAVWKNDIPVWSMNYCGRNLAPSFEGDFLKEALSLVPLEKPFRGPEIYTRDNMTYSCSVEGDFDWFNGYEAIYKGSEKVYECVFHGGKVEE